MNLYGELSREQKRLYAIISRDEKRLARLPQGTLKCYLCRKNGREYYTWYDRSVKESDGKTCHGRRIRKDERQFAEKLAKRGYLESCLETYRKQYKAIQLALKYYPAYEPGEKYLNKGSEYVKLLNPVLIKGKYTEEQWAWMSASRKVDQNNPEGLTVLTVMGYYVRSKSEAELVAKYVEHGIVFRYESPLFIKSRNKWIHPDFTITDWSTGEIYIHEHLGKMDDDCYVMDAAERIKMYMLDGWLPGKRLFVTTETLTEKFTSKDAEAFIMDKFSNLSKK